MSNKYHVTMLVGNRTYHGVAGGVLYYPGAEVAAAAKTMLGKPVRWTHDGHEVVGRVAHSYAESGVLKGIIELDPKQPKYALAKGFFDGALALGVMPNVSIEDEHFVHVEDGKRVARNIQFTALGLVPRGACNDALGCGVQRAALSTGAKMTENTDSNTALPSATNTAEAVVTFEEVKEKAALCGCTGKPAEPDTSEMDGLKAKLAAVESEKSALAAKVTELSEQIAKAPLVAQLAALAPGYVVDGKSVAQLESAVEAVKLAQPKTTEAAPAVRKTMLAESASEPPVSPKDAYLAEIRAHTAKLLRK